MTDEAQPQNPPKEETKGILATITAHGTIDLQTLGNLNEAEFLGIGAYLSNILMKDGILALHRDQRTIGESLEKVSAGLQLIASDAAESEQLCGKDSHSDSSPSVDSGLSSESSRDQSEE